MLVLSRKKNEALMVGDALVMVTNIGETSVSVTLTRDKPMVAATDTELQAAQTTGTELAIEAKTEWSFVIERDRFIAFGDDCSLTLIDLRSDKCRLGVEAPRHVPVNRKEVFDAIQRERPKE